MYWIGNSMNNLSSYCGLVDTRISAPEKDLPVQYMKTTSSEHVVYTNCILFMFWHSEQFVYVPVISKTLEHIETFNTNYKDFS